MSEPKILYGINRRGFWWVGFSENLGHMWDKSFSRALQYDNPWGAKVDVKKWMVRGAKVLAVEKHRILEV